MVQQRPNETCYFYLTSCLFIDLHALLTASRNAEEIMFMVDNNWNKSWDVSDELACVEEKGW